MIKERYCSSEVSKLLKKKGFDKPCYRWYDSNGDICAKFINPDIPLNYLSIERYLCPTHQMACDWLMTKDIYICPKYCCFQRCKKNDKPCCKWEPTILSLLSSAPLYPQPLDMCEYYDTFGEAVEAALKYVLENLI